MRISSGSVRGRIVKAPKGVDLRPTEERVRQALFNILAPVIVDARFVDLFCGTGAVGLEALSRGAAFVLFADKESRCLASAKEHWSAFGFPAESAEFLRAEHARALEALASRKERFDFIFLDPPYESPDGLDALRRLGGLDILEHQPHARVILEHPKTLATPESEGSLRLLRRSPYGRTTLSFYAGAHAD